MEIRLSNGRFTGVDDVDFQRISQWSWSECHGYAMRTGRKSGGVLWRKTILMHRQIMGVNDPDIEVDHHDRNRLNNHRSNLRLCTRSENHANVGLLASSTSGCKGVCLKKDRLRDKPWQASITLNGKVLHIGCFATKVEAARAYSNKASELFGRFACSSIL